jgi:hypothetical protein
LVGQTLIQFLTLAFYDFEFPDGTISSYAANMLAEALYSQLDADGNCFLLLKEIVDHEKGAEALSYDEARIVNEKAVQIPHEYSQLKVGNFIVYGRMVAPLGTT